MKRAPVVLVLIALAAVLPARATVPVCAPPRCVDVTVPVPDGLKVPERTVRVLLPEGYLPKGQGRGYPVLYLLHGAGDTFQTWSLNTDIIEFSEGLRLIIVMPDGGKNQNAGWYSDWADDSRDWETFHTGVLVDQVEATFNTLGPGHRGVAGLSMGGFGAMKYAARYPGRFQAAASFSGAVDMMYLAPASGVGFTAFHDQFGTPNDDVWGNQLAASDNWRGHNPTDLAGRLQGVDLWVATGTGTPGGPAGDDPGNPGGYAIENVIFQMNVSFARALLLADVPFTQDFYAGGLHSWPYWERELHRALPQMLEVIG